MRETDIPSGSPETIQFLPTCLNFSLPGVSEMKFSSSLEGIRKDIIFHLPRRTLRRLIFDDLTKTFNNVCNKQGGERGKNTGPSDYI